MHDKPSLGKSTRNGYAAHVMSTRTTKKTPKKTSAAKKSTARKAAKVPKGTSAKSAPKPAPKKGTPEDHASEQALKLIDKAAGILRKGVREGATASSKARAAAYVQANSLLTNAQKSLSGGLSSAGSSLSKGINKAGGAADKKLAEGTNLLKKALKILEP